MATIKRNFIYNIILNISRVIFPLITAPYVSRVLEPDGVGLFNFSNTYASYFALFAALGIPMYGIREIAKIRDDKIKETQFVSELITISTIATIICIIIMLLSLVFVTQLKENYIIFLISGIVLYLTPIRIDWYYSGHEEFRYITYRSLIIKFISVLLLFLLVKHKDDLIIYVLLNALSQIANEIWNFVKLYKSGIHPFFTLSGIRHLKPLFLLLSSSIAISIYAILDTIMLGFLTNYEEVGYYNNATHISKSLLPIVTSLAAVAIPKLSVYIQTNNWNEINKIANKSMSIVTFLCFPIFFGVVAIAPIFVPLFFGNLYYGTIIPLQIIIGLVVAIGLNNLTGLQLLIGLGMDKLFLKSVVVGSVSNFLLNLFMIPLYGASGAAISSVFAETMIFLVTLYYVYKNTSIRFKNMRNVIRCIICASFFIPLEIILQSFFSDWILIFVFVIVCCLFYLILQFFFKNEVVLLLLKIIKDKIYK